MSIDPTDGCTGCGAISSQHAPDCTERLRTAMRALSEAPDQAISRELHELLDAAEELLLEGFECGEVAAIVEVPPVYRRFIAKWLRDRAPKPIPRGPRGGSSTPGDHMRDALEEAADALDGGERP